MTSFGATNVVWDSFMLTFKVIATQSSFTLFETSTQHTFTRTVIEFFRHYLWKSMLLKWSIVCRLFPCRKTISFDCLRARQQNKECRVSLSIAMKEMVMSQQTKWNKSFLCFHWSLEHRSCNRNRNVNKTPWDSLWFQI